MISHLGVQTSVAQQIDTGKDEDDNRYLLPVFISFFLISDARFPLEYEVLASMKNESQFDLQAHTVALKKLPSFSSSPVDLDMDKEKS